jgi:hypothetical protein
MHELLRKCYSAVTWHGGGVSSWRATRAARLSDSRRSPQALKGMSGTDAAVILTTEPIWAIAWASLLVGEHVGPSAVVGGTLVIAACAVNFLGEAATGDAKEKEA